MSPRPPEDDVTTLESLERRVSVLQQEHAAFASVNDVLQTNTARGMTQRGDLEAHLKKLGEAVLGMLNVLSNNSLIVVKDGLIVPEHISIQGLNPAGATAEVQETKKQLEQEVMMLRREFDVIKIMHQRATCEQQNKDRHIEHLNNQIKNQREILLQIDTEQKILREDQNKTERELKAVEDRFNSLNNEKRTLELSLNELTISLLHEQRLRQDISSEKSKAEEDFKKIKATVTELQKKNLDLESWISQHSMMNTDFAINVHGEHINMSKLKAFKGQRSRFTEIPNGIHQIEQKSHSIPTADKYYDYSGPQADIMKRLSLDSLSKYFDFIDY